MNSNEKTVVTLTCEGKSYTYVVPDDFLISEATINKDLAEHPGKFVWFSVLAARLVSERDRLGEALKEARAAADVEVRKQFAVSGQKTTEDGVRAKVETSITVKKVLEDLQKATEQASLAMAIKESFLHRKDALVSLAANMRDELTAPNSVRERKQ